MNAQRFESLVEAYGAEPRRWPAGERAAAEAFARTGQGAALLAAAAELDCVLEAAPAPQPSAASRARILEAAPRPRAWRGELERWLRAVAPGAGLVAAGLAGVLFGATLSGPAPGEAARAEILLAEAGAFEEAALAVDGL